MRILITGALGVLGAPLTTYLREDAGHEVWGCDLRHDGDPRYVRADVANLARLERAFTAAQPDAVYHLAAEFGRHNGEAFTEQLWRTAMVGTRNVLELCRDYGSHLIFASSSEVYGEYVPVAIGPGGASQAASLHESVTEKIVINHPNEYALSKWANECQIRAFMAREPELRATILRFFNAYGPGEAYHPFRSVVALFCEKALRGEPLPVYRGYHRTFMYVDDFVPTLANVCEPRELDHLVYNIGGVDYRSVEELAEIVLAEVNDGAGEVELIGEDAHNTRSKLPDIERARAELGHDPKVRLEEGVPLTLEWMMRHGRHAALAPA